MSSTKALHVYELEYFPTSEGNRRTTFCIADSVEDAVFKLRYSHGVIPITVTLARKMSPTAPGGTLALGVGEDQRNQILAWLDHWRDSNLSRESVTQLQDILNIPRE